jgi:hypothetical protein
MSERGARTGTLLRRLLDQSRFTFYPKAQGGERWYELGVTPSLAKFFSAVPSLSKALASPTGVQGLPLPERRRVLKAA